MSAPRLEALWAEHTGDLLGYALRRTSSREDAVDVVSEVFLVAWRRIEEVPGDNEARLWLFGVARNVVANQRRGERRRGALAIRLAMHLDTLAPPVEPPPDTGLRLALSRLKEVDREILTLTAWDRLTPAEAATVLGIPASTARVRLHRARERLHTELKRPGLTGHVLPGSQPDSSQPSQIGATR